MKKTFYTILLATTIGLIGCQSEEEKIREKQIEVCRENIKSGQEPSQFCINLLPEYRNVGMRYDTQQVGNVGQEYVPNPAQYEPQMAPTSGQVVQQPQYIPVPTPAQNTGSNTSDTIRDMAIGGMVGHLIGSNSGSNNNSNYIPRTGYESAPRYITNKHVTVINKPAPVINKPAPVTAPVQKKNYMDTSKLNSYGSRTSVTTSRPISKPSSFTRRIK